MTFIRPVTPTESTKYRFWLPRQKAITATITSGTNNAYSTRYQASPVFARMKYKMEQQSVCLMTIVLLIVLPRAKQNQHVK